MQLFHFRLRDVHPVQNLGFGVFWSSLRDFRVFLGFGVFWILGF